MPLLERDAELARGAELLGEAAAGDGRLLVIEGPAGIGKSVLLDAICTAALAKGFLPLRARAGEIEREFPYGVVRQLFEAELRGRSAGDRNTLLAGAAELAAPVVAPEAGAERPSADPFGVVHGLYWLTANLADERPLVIAVDDVQWSDAVSQRFLAHLGRRLEGLPLLVAVCIRTGEPVGDELLTSEMTTGPDATLFHPAPLSQEAVGQLVAERLGAEPDPGFAAACTEVTGGTPFLVGELVTELGAREIRPDRESSALVREVVPKAVARSILARLRRLAAPAIEVARAVAVLGGDARLHRAATLADVSEADAVDTVERLVAASIFRSGLPLDFAHPVIREAVYSDMSSASRAAAHARAADLLAGEGAEVDAVAGHLLLSEPAARSENVEHLRRAATHALDRGAPDNAAIYLRRALEEGGLSENVHAECLLELGHVERHVTPRDAIEHFQQAHKIATEPSQRVRAVYELADTVMMRPRQEDVVPLIDAAITEAEQLDPEVAIRLEALRFQQSMFDQRLLPSTVERLPKLRANIRGDSRGGRLTALVLASAGAATGRPAEEIEQLVRTGMPGGALPPDEPPDSWVMVPMFNALVGLEALDDGLRAADALADLARERGSTVGINVALGGRCWMNSRRGDLVAVEADLRAILALAEQHDFAIYGAGAARWLAIDAMIERPDLADEAETCLELDFAPETEGLYLRVMLLEMRGRIRLAAGDSAGAIEDLRQCALLPEALGNPNDLGWRPALALALAPTDPDEALELARAELQHAERFTKPPAIGRALRVLGMVERGEKGLAHLMRAVEVLDGSPARLELARALVELGAAQRRAGQRADAREPLRRGLDLAHRCGATRLEQRARDELAATGARPRRAVLTGRDALTATEQRIAQMAADGMSNREIAQALFVTSKTVENHLGRVYPKLGINSRKQLAGALASDAKDEGLSL